MFATGLCRASLLDGHEHSRQVPGVGATVGLQIRAKDGHETCVGMRIIGSVPDNLAAVVLARVPGYAGDGWFPEYAMPERPLAPAEQVWSNVMDQEAAAQLLGDDDD